MPVFNAPPFLPAISCTPGVPTPMFSDFVPVPDGKVGVVYPGFWVLPNPGVTGNFTYSGLPGGLSGSTAGVITGTPSAAGTFAVTITLTTSTPLTVSRTFTFTILP